MATDVFLSHDWGVDCNNHTKVSKINDALKKLGYVTWFDNERMTGNIREQMSNGIENTKCCIAFITENYHEKVVNGADTDNCKLEFSYGSNKVTGDKKLAMIAVVLDASMKNPRDWKGNVGMSLGLKIYIDMSGDIDDEEYLSTQLIQLKKELSAINIEPSINLEEARTTLERNSLEPTTNPDNKPQHEPKDYEGGCSKEELSNKLKEETRKSYSKIQANFASKSSSLSCNDIVERDDIIVELSLTNDNVFSMEAGKSDITDISDLREKQKEIASENKIDYQNILSSKDDYVIISAVPGGGKTTLVETLLYQWGSNQIWNSEVKFDFVFVIYLRRLAKFKTQKDVTAEQILSSFYPDFDEICRLKSTKSLLILEGFDELNGKEELCFKKIKKITSYIQAIQDLFDPHNTKLPFTRIVTSRPSSCPILFEAVLPQPCNLKTLEVTGFSEQTINRYIRKHFPEENQANKVIASIKDVPIVYDIMVNPFYCWGVCYLMKSDLSVKNFAQTLTSLYAHLLVLLIRNHGFRDPSKNLIEVTYDPKFKDICEDLAELSFAVHEDQQICFSREYLPERINIDDLVRDSGLIIEIKSYDMLDSYTTYQFLHYTFHEFLIALHLFITNRNEESLIREPSELAVFDCDGTIFEKKAIIASMHAGLLGGALAQSESNPLVQSISKLFNTGGCLKTKIDYIPFINVEFLFRIVFEFHNSMDIDNKVILFGNYWRSNSYTNHCKLFFEKQCASNKFKIDEVTFLLIGDSFYKLKESLRFFKHDGTIYCISKAGAASLVKVMSEDNINYLTVLLKDGCFKEHVADLIKHAETLETFGFGSDLLYILRSLGEEKETRLTKKLIFHVEEGTNVTVRKVIDHADVCEEIVIALNVRTNRFTSKPSDFEPVTKLQRDLSDSYSKKDFKTLKSITAGATCSSGHYSPMVSVAFTQEEARDLTCNIM